MKVKVQSDEASTLRKEDWSQMGDWLAQLRDDSRSEPPGDGHAGADSADEPWQAALAQADVLAEARARAEARAAATARAVIGDELRIPIMWCEMGSCISWYSDREALGEADTRARAIGAGWRIDALGRLACPRCQQTDPRFWAACPLVPQDRYAAIGATARPGNHTAGSAAGTSRDPGRAASGYPPSGRAELEWHHDFPAGQVMPVGWSAERASSSSVPAA